MINHVYDQVLSCTGDMIFKNGRSNGDITGCAIFPSGKKILACYDETFKVCTE